MFYIRSIRADAAKAVDALQLEPADRTQRGITCDGTVTPFSAQFSQCDGVMARIASFSKTGKN
jgi:hypothetical protein